MKSRKRRSQLQEPVTELKSDLWMEPWMRYTGISFLAALIIWFRRGRRNRPRLLVPFVATAGLFLVGLVALWLLVWLVGRL